MIRKAKNEDFKRIVYVDANSGLPFYEKNPERKKDICQWLKPIFDNKINEFYVYEKEKNIVGLVALKKDFPNYDSCELIYLSVLKEEHRKGIGKQLLKFIGNKAKLFGFKRIFVYTGDDNIVAQHLYEKFSYEKINEFPSFYSWGQTAFLYGKWVEK